MDRAKLSQRLLVTFAGEVAEQARALSADVLVLEQQPGDAERLQSVFRVAHTLKGAARAAGVPVLEQLCHALESRLAELRRGTRKIAPADVTCLLAVVDALQEAGRLLQSGGDLHDSALPALTEALTTGTPPPVIRASRPMSAGAAPTSAAEAGPSDGLVKVHAEKLGALLAASGELLVERSRADVGSAEIAALAEEIGSLATRWRSMGRALRLAAERGSFGPRELDALRSLDDSMHYLTRRTSHLASAAGRDTRSLGAAVDRMAERMREVLLRPFGDATEPLARTVRDLAQASGKEVRFEADGTGVEADRAVLDGLRDALLQLVRNAVDHGIEPPEEREQAGKPRVGTIRLSASLTRDRIVVTVADDGAGLQETPIRAALAARGLPAPAEDGAIGDALLTGRITTRSEATMLSGRGVGLDIVRSAVERIQGTIQVSWLPGKGTTFTIECQPSLATTRAILVEVGTHVLAIPASYVTALLRVSVATIQEVQGRQTVATPDGPVPLASLARVLGPPLAARAAAEVIPVALLTHGGRALAVAVDALVAEQEIVLRPVLGNGAPVGHLSGATVLGDGRVAPVLNVAAVVAAGLSTATGGVELAAGTTVPLRRRVLVVDDSITTRTLEESMMESAGYEVLTAVDGADAWRKVQEQGCDLVITDVDMPRMNGLDLCRAIRSSKRFRELPVILVSALESDEDRQRGMELGADAYMTKSGFDQHQLLETARQLLGA